MASSHNFVLWSFCCLVLFIFPFVSMSETDQIEVDCAAGSFLGKVESFNIRGKRFKVKQFLGIPYAEAPIGKLRFQKTVKKEPLYQTYNATEAKPWCIDRYALFDGNITGPHGEEKDEDCLFLNIFVPGDDGLSSNLPVIIFIHESSNLYDLGMRHYGEIFSSLGTVIFVQVNFRTNVFGFTSTGDDHIPGNAGFWDQHIAIQWVHDNIGAFGGDPGLVTLFGYYEGASNVVYQAMYPGNKDLFKRIIVNCGDTQCTWAFNRSPYATTKMIAMTVGCLQNETGDLVHCLTSKSTEEFLDGVRTNYKCDYMPYETIASVDGSFLKKPPYETFVKYFQVGSQENLSLSNFEIMTAVYGDENLMLIKTHGNPTGVMTLTNDSLIIGDEVMDRPDDLTFTVSNETLFAIKTVIEFLNDTLTIDNRKSKFDYPVLDIARTMFGLDFSHRRSLIRMNQISNRNCQTDAKSLFGCFLFNLPYGGPAWADDFFCFFGNTTSIESPDEIYHRYRNVYRRIPPLFRFSIVHAYNSNSKMTGWWQAFGVFEDLEYEVEKAAVDVWTDFARSGALSSVVALGANIICNKIPGLAPRQRAICRSRPVAIAVIGGGARLGLNECQFQFRYSRWNCTMASKYDSMFGYQHDIASREAAVWSAMSSAGVVYAITQACSLGTLNECGCDKSRMNFRYESEHDFMWGGCSADIKYGLKLGRKFLDAREIEETARSLMNKHNNRVGRKAVRDKMKLECRCHGPTASCSIKTCWRRLPSLREVGGYLFKQYRQSRQVVPWLGSRLLRPNALVLKKSNRPNRKPRRRDLVYLERSPNFCEYNLTTGSLGTVGRKCNKGSRDTDGCTLMCCGRGYNTHQYTRTWQCNCTFRWCCEVSCKNCTEKQLEYTCK